jgi:hypothetical protein
MMVEPETLTSVLRSMDNTVEGDKLTLGEILDALGSRGFGPLILAAISIELMPTGGIPGIPTMVATVVILLAGQMVAGRSSPWVPGKIKRKGFSLEKFKKARGKIEPVTRRVGRLLKPRLRFLTTAIAAKAVGILIILIALTMPPLELIPGTGYFPAVPIALLALGLSGRDGLFILLGAGIAVAGAVGALWVIL